MNRIAHIDGLRAVAVLAVLLYHLGFTYFPGGFVGVDVFFVISGYVITRMIQSDIEKGRFTLRRFYAGRIRRLMPALMVTITLSGVAASLFMTPEHLKDYAASSIAAIFAWSNFFFWSQVGYFDATAQTKPLLHTWTLSVEWQFYLIWPAFIWLLLRGAGARTAFWIIVLLAATSFGANFVFRSDPSTIFYWTPFRIFEFALGGLLLWLPSPRGRAVAEAATTAGLVLIALSVLLLDHSVLFPSYNALPPVLGAMLVIWSAGSSLSGRIIANPVATYLGRISYSIYLVHWPLIVFTAYALFRPLGLQEACLVGIASLILGAASYHFVELPFWKGNLSKLRGRKAAFALSIAVGVMVIPATLAWHDGWPWRLDPASRTLASTTGQFRTEQYGGAGFEVNRIIALAPGEPAFLIAGDSHALQFATGRAQTMAELGVGAAGLFDHGCFIGPDTTRFGTNDSDQQACTGEYQMLLDALEDNSLPLALAFNWSGYNGIIGPPGGDAIEFASYDDYYTYITGKLDEIKRAIGDRRLVIVGTVPGSGTSASSIDCILRPSLAKFACQKAAAWPIEKSNGYTINRILEAWASRNRVEYLAFYDDLCKDDVCNAVADGNLLFSDANHLSKAGSILVGPTLVAQLLKP